jgi:hypothetical protein
MTISTISFGGGLALGTSLGLTSDAAAEETLMARR